MKKIFALATLLVAALALTNCSKEETVTPAVEKNFTVYADLGATRTIADGYTTSWASGDAMNIWHAVAGETTYTHDGEFTLTDAELGAFDGTVTGVEEGTSYDWFAFYPYQSFNSSKTPAYTAYYAIAAQTQQQTGDNNTTHTSNAPLYGVVKGGSSVAPEFSMKHLSSMLKIKVTNLVDEAISVKSIVVATESSKITGTFHVDMTGEAPAYTSSGDTYTFTTATLNVAEGGDLAAEGGSADYYLTICPFTAAEGETLTVTVTNNGDEVCERTYTLNGKTFNPGKVTTLNFDFEANAEMEWTTIADIHAATAEGTYNIQNATVVAVGKYNSLLYDGTGYLFSYQNLGVAVGDVINITNALTSTYGERQIKSGATVEKIGTTTVEHPEATVLADGAAFDDHAANYTVGDYVTVNATKIASGNYVNFYVAGASKTGSLVTPASDMTVPYNVPVAITGYTCYLNGSYFYFFATNIEVLPYLNVNTSAMNWGANAVDAKTVTVSSNIEGWTVQSAAEWVTAEKTNETTLTITPKAHETGEAQTGTVVLQHATEGIVVTINISRDAAGAAVTVMEESFDAVTTGDNTTSSGSSNAWTGNDNFPTVSTAYCAGGAVRIGKSKGTGYILSKELDLSSPFKVTLQLKGWSSVEGSVKVTVGEVSQTITYTETMTGDFGEYSVSFDAATANSTVKIETTAKRAFIGHVLITK